MARAKAKVMMSPSHNGRPYWVIERPRMRPAQPIIEPMDRSNSPAIISRATVAPRIPIWAATWM